MATYSPSYSIGTLLLQLIRDASDQQHFSTEEELVEKIRETPRPYSSGFYFELKWKKNIGPILNELKGLGLIKRAPNQEDTGFSRWEVGDSWKPPRRGDDEGNNNFPPPQNGDDGGPDGDGGGIREVLSHPLLFSLDSDEFDELVDDLFPKEEK